MRCPDSRVDMKEDAGLPATGWIDQVLTSSLGSFPVLRGASGQQNAFIHYVIIYSGLKTI